MKNNTEKDQLSAFDKFTYSNLKEITIEELLLSIDRGNIRAHHIDGIFDSITNKTYAVLSLSTTVFIGVSSYLFLNHDFNGSLDAKLCSVFIMALTSFYACFILIGNVNTVKYRQLGGDPTSIINKEFYLDGNKDFRINRMLFSQVVNIKMQIDINNNACIGRTTRLNNSIKLVVLIPFIGFLSYSILTLLL